MMQASSGRSGKQRQQQNSSNLGPLAEPCTTPVARAEMCLQKLRAAIRPRHFNGFRESFTWCESQFSTIAAFEDSVFSIRPYTEGFHPIMFWQYVTIKVVIETGLNGFFRQILMLEVIKSPCLAEK